jgi:hypothetical protein
MANLKTDVGRPKIFTFDDDNVTAEEKLWKAVLYQGVFEALTYRYNALPLTDREKKESMIWIDPDNEDFKEVCENAGFSANYIFKQIRKVLDKSELENKTQINLRVANTIKERETLKCQAK